MSNTIKEQLKADLTVSFKARQELETAVLRSVIGAIQTQEKSGKVAVEFDDAKVLEVLASEANKRRATAAEYTERNVPDRAARETAEADFLDKYLPAQLSAEEIEAIVDAAITSTGATSVKEFGQVMKAVTAETKGRADGKTVSTLVRAKLT